MAQKIQPGELSNQILIENGPRIIDLRAGDGYAEGHIPGAQHIPILRLQASPGFVQDDRPIIVYSSGAPDDAEDENTAVAALQEKGIAASILEGGYAAWVKSGLPIEYG